MARIYDPGEDAPPAGPRTVEDWGRLFVGATEQYLRGIVTAEELHRNFDRYVDAMRQLRFRPPGKPAFSFPDWQVSRELWERCKAGLDAELVALAASGRPADPADRAEGDSPWSPSTPRPAP